MEKIKAGDVVYCGCGRDEGYFAVMKAEGKFLFLADGKRRKTENPKKKNIKHAAYAGVLPEDIADRIRTGGKVGNERLKEILKGFGGEQKAAEREAEKQS